ncbi:MAG: peptide ABC transporter permease, partial [Actinomycetales bacterium]
MTSTVATRRRPSVIRAWVFWIIRRFGFAVLSLWLVSLIVFIATNALGDPVRAILGKDYAVSPQRVADLEKALHLDLPLMQRYMIWLTGLLQGDLGTSVANGMPVSTLIGPNVINSAFLVFLVAIIMVPVAIGLAMLSGRNRGGVIDNIIQFFTLAMAGIPEFVTGILLVALFSTSVFHIFPAVTTLPPGYGPWTQ